MDVIRLPYIDWEPLLLRIYLEAPPPNDAEAVIQRLIQDVVIRRREEHVCGCCLKSLSVTASSETSEVRLACEWMCEKCLGMFRDALTEMNPTIARLEIGHELEKDTVEPSDRHPYIPIQPTTVFVTSGVSVAICEPFMIARRSVTVQQFEDFVAATGYVSQAEREGDADTFRENACLRPFANEARKLLRATCLSFGDAEAYCRWVHARLPTEVEWLAADMLHSNELEGRNAEWVTAYDNPGAPLMRSGPAFRQRHHWPPDAYDIMAGFRVVRPK